VIPETPPNPHQTGSSGRATPQTSPSILVDALRKKLAFWKTLGSQWATSVIENGLFLQFESRPAFRPPPPHKEFSVADRKLIGDSVKELLAKGAICRIETGTPGYYSRIFVVPKPNGTMRPVLDLRDLNTHLRKVHFKMETFSSILPILRPKDWMVKFDLKDAYLHVPMATSAQRYMQFVWEGQAYRCQAMLFGLTSAPRTFTKLMSVLMSHLRAKGIRLVFYLDDILLLACSREEAIRVRDLVADILKVSGLTINSAKSVLDPAQEVIFLGLHVSTLTMVVSLPQAKLHDIRKLAGKLVKLSKISLRTLSRFLGKVQAAQPAIVPANLFLFHLRSTLREGLRAGNWESEVILNPECLEELGWWKHSSLGWNGRALMPEEPTVRVASDASEEGFGGCCNDLDVQHDPPLGWEQLTSNERELKAATSLVRFDFRHLTKGRVVELLTDNLATAWTINRMFSPSVALFSIAKDFLLWCLHSNTKVVASWIPGVLNYESDALSRRSLRRSDWGLDPNLLPAIERAFGLLDIDLFASDTSALLPRFFALPGSTRAEAFDAFSKRWTKLRGLANPPFRLIPKVLQKIEKDQATVVLVAPFWKGAIWWPDLVRLAVKMLPLPTGAFIRRGDSDQPYQENPHWSAAAWLVSGDPKQHVV